MATPVSKDSIDFMVNLQGVSNEMAEQIEQIMIKGDREVIEVIEELYKSAPAPFTDDMVTWLRKVESELEKCREKFVIQAKDLVYGDAEPISEAAQQAAVNEIESFHEKFPHRIKGLTKTEFDFIRNYQPFNGQSINQWFNGLAKADLTRVYQAVVVNRETNGGSLDTLIRRLAGTATQRGVLQTTRTSARMIARTCVNGLANTSRLRVFARNADVLDGVRFVATLDHSTSAQCAGLDGTIWPADDLESIKRPPMHPNCRSVLVPYIKIEGEEGAKRAAEEEDFELLAQKEHDAKYATTGKGKPWDKLTYDTRQKKYYKYIKGWSKETGKQPFRQVPGGQTFPEYFANQLDYFQRQWLGAGRYKMYIAGTLDIRELVDPDTGFRRTIDQLKDLVKR